MDVDDPKLDFFSFQPGGLKTHIMRVHEGITPYHCTLCDRKYTQKTSLDYHMKTHTGNFSPFFSNFFFFSIFFYPQMPTCHPQPPLYWGNIPRKQAWITTWKLIPVLRPPKPPFLVPLYHALPHQKNQAWLSHENSYMYWNPSVCHIPWYPLPQ